jgi:RNA-directed DNA polymerase
MKESYRKGLATHPDPESCGTAREGKVEALTGAHAGKAMSREMCKLRDVDAVYRSGRQQLCSALSQAPQAPARSKTLGMRGNSMHENREISRSPRMMDPAVAWGRLMADRPR